MSTDIERTRHAAKVMTEYADYCEKHGKPPKWELLDRRVVAQWKPSLPDEKPIWAWHHLDYRLVPDPPLSVEVGGWYETRGGRVGHCYGRTATNGDSAMACGSFVSDGTRPHFVFVRGDGQWMGERESEYDLIRRIDPPEFAKAWARAWLGKGPEVMVFTHIDPPRIELTPELRAWLIEHGATIKE